MLFNFLKLKFNKNDILDGQYIDMSQFIINKNLNYYIEINNIIVGIYISDININEIHINNNVFNFLDKIKQKSSNRGAIAGIIDFNRIDKQQQRRIENNEIILNKSKTRSIPNINYKFSFSNVINSFIFNNRNRRSIKYKNEINKYIKPIILKINDNIKKYYKELITDKQYLDSYFTDIIINKKLRSAVHSDSHNSINKSALIILSPNKKCITNLNLPDYNVSFPMIPNKSLLILDLTNIRHSNDYINNDIINDRYSMVLYSHKKYINEALI